MLQTCLCASSEAGQLLLQRGACFSGRLIATSSLQQAADDSTAAEADPQAADVPDTASAAGAASRTPQSHGARAPHVSLDDPVLNIYLRFNTQFMTDPDRAYAIGHRNAFENTTTLELRKALAAHRLQLRDAAAAQGSHKQRLAKQMNSRLAEMRAYMADPSFR